MSSKAEVSAFIKNLPGVSEAYRSWGKVSLLNIITRNSDEVHPEKELVDAIFAKRKNINCILVTRQEYASTLSEEVPPILDDQAQLLGVSIRMADNTDKATATAKTIWALKSRYATVLSDGRCVCIGGTIDDAYIAAQLLEKTAKAYLEARHIGGAKSINRLEAWAMQMYYQFKYAKEAKKNR